MIKRDFEHKQTYAIRKLTVGAASVLIGISFMAVNGKVVYADSMPSEIQHITATKVDNTKVDNTKVYNTKVDNTKVDNTKVDNTKVDNTKVDNTKVDNTKVDNTKVDNTKVDNTINGGFDEKIWGKC